MQKQLSTRATGAAAGNVLAVNGEMKTEPEPGVWE